MTTRLRFLTCAAALAASTAGAGASAGLQAPAQAASPQTAPPPAAPPARPSAPQAPFDITKTNMVLDVVIPGEIAAAKYDQAAKSCEDLIVKAKEQPPTPEILKVLIRAYEAQGRARIYVKDGLRLAYDDFYNLLCLDPNHKLAEPVSDTEVTEFQKVKDSTLGHVSLSMDPKGMARLEREKTEGQSYPLSFELNDQPKTIDLVAGQYRVTATNETGRYEQFEDTFTVASGTDVREIKLNLVRKMSRMSIVTIPAGAEILLDDRSLGRTTSADGSAAPVAVNDLQPASETKTAVSQAPKSAALTIEDVTPEVHKLQLRLKCFKPIDLTFTIVRKGAGDVKADVFNPGDLSADTFHDKAPEIVKDGAFRLTPSTTAAKLAGNSAGATLWLDGERQKAVPSEAITLCEGPHTLEVRGPHGRFIDAREWKTSDTEAKIDVRLRDAFAISNLPAGQSVSDPMQRKALDAIKDGMLLYVPYEKEFAEAAKESGGPALDFWSGKPTDTVTPEGRTRRWRDLARKLEAQGLAAVTADATNPGTIRIALLAPGSSVASVITINTEDPTSIDQARATVTATLPSFWRRTVGVSVIDVDHVKGAVVVRAEGAGAAAGLKAGDTVVRAGGTAIETVADWDAVLRKTVPGASLPVEVKGADQNTFAVPVGVAPAALAFAPNTKVAALRGSALPANVALVGLQAALSAPASAANDKAIAQAAGINLALIHWQLGNWSAALEALNGVDVAQLGDAGGISAGTIAYLKGLCDEKLDKDVDAQAEFRKAAAARLARLDADGPLVWPLAQLKIHK